MMEPNAFPFPVERIMEMLPHRFPFLMIDRVTEAVKDSHVVCLKNVTINEHHFIGHFEGKPVMPGVLIIEAMAQASAVLVVEADPSAAGKKVYFMSADEVKFRKPVVPGDQLIIRANKLQNRRNIWKTACEAQVDGAKVAEAVITAMILD